MAKSLFFALFLTLSAPALGRTLLVVSGGYQTCPQGKEVFRPGYVPDVFDILKTPGGILEKLESEDADVDLIWSCYSGVLNHPIKRVASHGPMSFHYGLGGAPLDLRPIAVDAVDLDDGKPLVPFFDFVRAHIAKSAPQRIYLAGHSYGGWTVLQLGTRLVADGVDLSGTVLLDAISPFQCPANIMVSCLLLSWKSPEGCLKAPRDIIGGKLELLARHSGWLLNVYQTRFPYLHSGKMTYPGWDNQEITTFPKKVPFGDFHSYLAVDPRAWGLATAKP